MLVLTPKYGSQIDLDLLKKQKKETLITHRNDIIYLTHCKDIKEAYLTFLKNKDKYIIGYKPKDAAEINVFVKSLGIIDTLDVSWIDVSELNIFFNCFVNCKANHIVGLNKWDVSNVTDMAWMFNGCENLESIDISRWDVSNTVNTYNMFNGCQNLKSVGDLNEWDVNNVGNMIGMFKNCENLENIGDISGWDVSKTAWLDEMFKGCKKLKSVGDLEQWNVRSNASTDNMFKTSAITPIPSWYTK